MEKKNNPITFMTTDTIKDELNKIAQDHYWTLSQLCYIITKEYIEERRRAKDTGD